MSLLTTLSAFYKAGGSSWWAAGNDAMRRKRYEDAIHFYEKAAPAMPELAHLINYGIKQARRKLNDSVDQGEAKVETIDIIVPVFNALHDLKACLQSLRLHTDGFDPQFIIVNDNSDDVTSKWLSCYCEAKAQFTLIEHQSNLGYTCAINAGLKASRGTYVIALNSDTIVTEGWLKGLVRCIRSHPKLGIVGPLSNAASWQNVPNLRDETGSFAVNRLPEGMSPADMARVVAKASERGYPRLPFVNGFCFMIRREVINTIGYMDEKNFPVGYGEENDYCIRAMDAGFELAIADDVYVFHAKSKSFGHDRRKQLSKQGVEALKRKHTPDRYDELVAEAKSMGGMDRVRSRIKDALEALTTTPSFEFMAMKILFLLPVRGGGGGAHSVVQEVTEMRRLGVCAQIALRHQDLRVYQRNYADIRNIEETFVVFNEQNLLEIASKFDVVVGTIFTSMALVRRIVSRLPHVMPAYYVQDYEPMFFDEGSARWEEACESYTLVKGAHLFAKTCWIIDKVKQHHKVPVHKVEPSLDHELYKPRPRLAEGKLVVTAMVRPQTPHRGATRTMRILKRLHQAYGEHLDIHVFGCNSDDVAFKQLERDFLYQNHGELTRPEVADLLGRTDLFVDLSDYQAFGRTALESMACGCAVVVPRNGGCGEFAIQNRSALILDTSDEETCTSSIVSLLGDRNRLRYLRQNSILAASRFNVHAAALSELATLHGALENWRHVSCFTRKSFRPRVWVLPSLTKNGNPVGSGYVRTIFPFQTKEMLKNFDIKIIDKLPVPEHGSIAILQRQASGIHIDHLRSWIARSKEVGMRIAYDLDDDLLDESALRERGYSPAQSKEVCLKVNLLAGVADVILASTEPLARRLASINPSVVVIPNGIDADLWGLDFRRRHDVGEYRKVAEGAVRVGYIGTPTHDADLDLITPAMKEIEQKFGASVEIEVIGGFEKRSPTFGRKVPLPKNNEYPNFVRWLRQRVHWDIAIIPLVNNAFNRSKSNLKFLECAALNTAIVVSDVPSYRSIAVNGENCLIAQAFTKDWVEKLTRVIQRGDLRQQLASNARSVCAQRFTLDYTSPVLVDALNRLVSEVNNKVD